MVKGLVTTSKLSAKAAKDTDDAGVADPITGHTLIRGGAQLGLAKMAVRFGSKLFEMLPQYDIIRGISPNYPPCRAYSGACGNVFSDSWAIEDPEDRGRMNSRM